MASVTESESTRKVCASPSVKVSVVGMRWRNRVFAHVATDEGIKGIGEGNLENEPKAVAAAIEQPAALCHWSIGILDRTRIQ